MEMLALLDKVKRERYAPLLYVLASTDTTSGVRVRKREVVHCARR
jgi:hypothetical protein